MALPACDSSFSFGPYCSNSFDPLSLGFSRFSGASSCNGFDKVPRMSLVLGNDKAKLDKASTSTTKKGQSPEKALAALKSHCEAERRRRERINSQLATLRGLVPCTDKMDKATLLAEVINQVKELKRNAIDATQGLLLPMDDDEVMVESCEGKPGDDDFLLRASVCCEYRPTLLSEIREALEALPLKLVNAEMSTVGGRLKNVFILRSECQKGEGKADRSQKLARSIHLALDSVLKKSPDISEYCPRNTPPGKKRRVSSFDLLSSSP